MRAIASKLIQLSDPSILKQCFLPAGPGDIVEAEDAEKLELHRLGATGHKTNRLLLVKVSCIHAALSRIRGTEDCLAPVLTIPQLPVLQESETLAPSSSGGSSQGQHPFLFSF